jgi:hypothetical protein
MSAAGGHGAVGAAQGGTGGDCLMPWNGYEATYAGVGASASAVRRGGFRAGNYNPSAGAIMAPQALVDTGTAGRNSSNNVADGAQAYGPGLSLLGIILGANYGMGGASSRGGYPTTHPGRPGACVIEWEE